MKYRNIANPVIIFLLFTLFQSCSTLSPLPPQPKIFSYPPASSGLLHQVSSHLASDKPADTSHFFLLDRNYDALSYRLALIDHAVSSIDAQYFIWQDDETGNLLLDRLLKAAKRGVRVRILVDDFALMAKTSDLALLDSQPNFDIKIYNPFANRESTAGTIGEYLMNFESLNRRMHNKLFIADGRFAVIGGRNIGNPYFGLSQVYNFRDLDILVTGAVLVGLQNGFDEFWNTEVAYPGYAMTTLTEQDNFNDLEMEIHSHIMANRHLLDSFPLFPKDWHELLLELPLKMVPGEAQVVQDDPIDVDGKSVRLIDIIDSLAHPSHEELTIATPYFLPAGSYLEELEKLSVEGVDVNIITNSLGSNNHTIVHSHYKSYRRKLLSIGTDLFEFNHHPAENIRAIVDVPPVRSGFVSMHAKVMVGDRKRCFIGSLNMDPRALEINTENGLYIESDELANRISSLMDEMMMPDVSWKVTTDDKGNLQWASDRKTSKHQPAQSMGQRLKDFFYQFIPLKNQL